LNAYLSVLSLDILDDPDPKKDIQHIKGIEQLDIKYIEDTER